MKRTSLLFVTVALLVAGCRQAPQDETAENESNAVIQLPRLPIAEPPMDRAALLTEVAKAASASALGADISDQLRKLDGKRFEVRIRFGCAPPAPPESATDQPKKGTSNAPAGPFNVRFNEEDRTLRLRAAPDLTLEDPWIASSVGESTEAAEGFWMHRPWLLTDGCPVAPRPEPAETDDREKPKLAKSADEKEVAPNPASEPDRTYRVGLAQFFTKTDPRTGRRDGRAYESTKVLPRDQQPSRKGYNLVLSGRLRHMPSGPVIACRSESVDLPPQCVVSAEFDRVWIEEPDTRTLIAEWGN